MEETPVTIEAMAEREPETTPASAVVDQKVVAELVARASAEGVSLTGEGGLLQQLTKLVLESSLEGELDAHLGYGKHDPAGRTGGNSRNGRRAKTVLTEVGPVEVEVPRDRDGSFEPQIVRKRQRRLDGVDGIVLSLSAKGLTTGEISAHLAEVYGASVSKDTISAITDRVVEGMTEWQSRPLDPVYPVIFVDAIRVKIRDGNVAGADNRIRAGHAACSYSCRRPPSRSRRRTRSCAMLSGSAIGSGSGCRGRALVMPRWGRCVLKCRSYWCRACTRCGWFQINMRSSSS
jgi:hypothetical protein